MSLKTHLAAVLLLSLTAASARAESAVNPASKRSVGGQKTLSRANRAEGDARQVPQDGSSVSTPSAIPLAVPAQAGPAKGACTLSTFRRGNPGCWKCISSLASPTNTCGYIGYYVGGGSQHGERRFPEEGVWGWDFRGHCLDHHPVLFWSHDPCKRQGGTGDYRTGLHEGE